MYWMCFFKYGCFWSKRKAMTFALLASMATSASYATAGDTVIITGITQETPDCDCGNSTAKTQKIQLSSHLGERKYSFSTTFYYEDGSPYPNFPYLMKVEDGQILRGVTDEKGNTERVWTVSPKKVIVYHDDTASVEDDESEPDDWNGEKKREAWPDAEKFTVNDITIKYSANKDEDAPKRGRYCQLFLRIYMGSQSPGSAIQYYDFDDNCSKFTTAKDDDVITDEYYDTYNGKTEKVAYRKKDLVSLNDAVVWNGIPPVRARFVIGQRYEYKYGTDPELHPTFMPYADSKQVFDYMIIDRNGREINLGSGKETGYAFYEYKYVDNPLANVDSPTHQFLDICYMATIDKPRVPKWNVWCGINYYQNFRNIDTSSLPWINVVDQTLIDLGDYMFPLVEIPGSAPVKPLIYSDYPITDDGRVSKGQAMCMADCPDGMLMKLLHEGQGIWGKSGRK